MISKEKKAEVIKKNATKDNDTGSSEVQIAILTSRIQEITEHLKANPNDLHSRRGLDHLVSRRKRLLKYLENNNLESYRALKTKLNLR